MLLDLIINRVITGSKRIWAVLRNFEVADLIREERRTGDFIGGDQRFRKSGKRNAFREALPFQTIRRGPSQSPVVTLQFLNIAVQMLADDAFGLRIRTLIGAPEAVRRTVQIFAVQVAAHNSKPEIDKFALSALKGVQTVSESVARLCIVKEFVQFRNLGEGFAPVRYRVEQRQRRIDRQIRLPHAVRCPGQSVKRLSIPLIFFLIRIEKLALFSGNITQSVAEQIARFKNYPLPVQRHVQNIP